MYRRWSVIALAVTTFGASTWTEEIALGVGNVTDLLSGTTTCWTNSGAWAYAGESSGTAPIASNAITMNSAAHVTVRPQPRFVSDSKLFNISPPRMYQAARRLPQRRSTSLYPMSVRHCGLRDYLVFASIGVSYCCEFIPNQIVTCRALGAGAWAGVAETTTGATGAGSTADAVVVRSLSVTRRTVADLASSGWRQIRGS